VALLGMGALLAAAIVARRLMLKWRAERAREFMDQAMPALDFMDQAMPALTQQQHQEAKFHEDAAACVRALQDAAATGAEDAAPQSAPQSAAELAEIAERAVLAAAPARVAELLSRLRETEAGTPARKELVEGLLDTLRVSAAAEKPLQRRVARAFVDESGPEILYSIESCMRGDWREDAKNGTLRAVSEVRKLPGLIGAAFSSYRGVAEANKQSAAERRCAHAGGHH
jgi:hypothetical protein